MCTYYLCPNNAPWWEDSQNKGLKAFWECFPTVDLTHNKTQGDYDESNYRQVTKWLVQEAPYTHRRGFLHPHCNYKMIKAIIIGMNKLLGK